MRKGRMCMDKLKVSAWYRVFLKKVLHNDKRNEKMQEKMKMTSQKDKNLAQVQFQYSVCFCIKMIFSL